MSFSDMMSSGRGPGVIGMVMALVVLLGFGVLFMFAFDEGFQGGELSDEAAIVQQGKDIENYQMTIDKSQATLDLTPQRVTDSKELVRLGRESQTLQQTIVTLGDKKKAVEAEIVEKKKVFEEYKDLYRAYVRGKAKDEKMDQLVTLTGVVYKNVDIREVTAIGIEIRHAEGHKRIPFEDLPDTMKDYYQFDSSQKGDAEKAEEAARKIHVDEVAVVEKQTELEMAKQRERDALADKEKRRRKIVEKEALILTIQSEIRDLNLLLDRETERVRGRSGPALDKTKSINRSIKAKNNQITDIRGEIRLKKAAL